MASRLNSQGEGGGEKKRYKTLEKAMPFTEKKTKKKVKGWAARGEIFGEKRSSIGCYVLNSTKKKQAIDTGLGTNRKETKTETRGRGSGENS